MGWRPATRRWIAAAAVGALLLAACSGDDGAPAAAGGPVTLEYWLWDSNQRPAYEQCAQDFTEANPDIRIEIQQYGFDDYWGNLTTNFAAQSPPDVFTNHLSQFPQIVENDLLLPLNDYIERDDVPLDIYFEGLTELWVTPDGSRYGLPKDWDTIAMAYNPAMLEEAGLTEDDLWNATWNPEDGGSFEDIMARLTVDANGVRGDEEGFNSSNVATYGFIFTSDFGYGQTTWANFAVMNGLELLDQNPWGTEYNYDDPAVAETLRWWAGVIDKGYVPGPQVVEGLGAPAVFLSGLGAVGANGSWTINSYAVPEDDVEVGFAPLPEGPVGRRSMFNGLADSITAQTDHPDEAWEWVKYLGSRACQDVVGRAAVVFPAIRESTDIAVEAFAERGIDVNAFTVYHELEDGTFLFPITIRAPRILDVIETAIERVVTTDAEAAPTLEAANQQVNNILQGGG